jgi:outer membrane protein
MAANEQAKLEKEASENQAQLQQLQAEFRRDTSVRQQADMEQYFNKVKESMQEVAKNDDYDLVLSRDVVPYAKEEIDMTQAVIANLNKQKN